jgi:hypothetical protein
MPAAYGLPEIERYKSTGTVMLSFFTRLGFLKTGILDVAETGNIYSFNVLFRSFLEHVLKVNYIFMRWVVEQNDIPGQEYLSLKPLEDLEYFKAWKWIADKSKDNMEKFPKELLKGLYPSLDKQKLKALEEIQAKFRYRQLIQAINAMLGESDINFLHKIVPNYSQLSSFMHGGPKADDFMQEYISEKNREKYLIETSDLTVMMFYSSVRWLFLMLAGIDNQYNSHLAKIHEEIKKYY